MVHSVLKPDKTTGIILSYRLLCFTEVPNAEGPNPRPANMHLPQQDHFNGYITSKIDSISLYSCFNNEPHRQLKLLLISVWFARLLMPTVCPVQFYTRKNHGILSPGQYLRISVWWRMIFPPSRYLAVQNNNKKKKRSVWDYITSVLRLKIPQKPHACRVLGRVARFWNHSFRGLQEQIKTDAFC